MDAFPRVQESIPSGKGSWRAGIETIPKVQEAFLKVQEAVPVGNVAIPGLKTRRLPGSAPAQGCRATKKAGRGRNHAPRAS